MEANKKRLLRSRTGHRRTVSNDKRLSVENLINTLFGSCFVIVLVVISIIWIPIIEAAQGSQLFHYIQSVTSFLAPPVCAVYVLAITWERINEKGAFWGLMIGLVLGMIRFVMEFVYTAPACYLKQVDTRPGFIRNLHYLHFGLVLFIIVCIATTVISLLTEKIDEIHLYRLTIWTKYSDKVRINLGDENKVQYSVQAANNNSVKKGSDNQAFEMQERSGTLR